MCKALHFSTQLKENLSFQLLVSLLLHNLEKHYFKGKEQLQT